MWFSRRREPGVAVIKGEDLVQALASQDSVFIVDVRTPNEFHHGHIPGAHHIPLAEMASRLKEIPKERIVVTVCHSGHRSHAAAKMLHTLGYQVKNLQGGMQLWRGSVAR